uniref:Titin n=1 Tax=Rhabditophanes sp. KR3021 TaxID=114890 RepID=A0AC35TVQ8_9BILA
MFPKNIAYAKQIQVLKTELAAASQAPVIDKEELHKINQTIAEAVQLSEKNCTNVVIKIQKETDEAIKNMLLETSNALTQAIPDAPEPPKKYESGEYVKWIEQAVAKVNVAKPAQTQEVVEKIVEKVVEKVVIKEVESERKEESAKVQDITEKVRGIKEKHSSELSIKDKECSKLRDVSKELITKNIAYAKQIQVLKTELAAASQAPLVDKEELHKINQTIAEAVQLSEKNCTNVVIKIQKETDEAIKNMLLETSNALTQAIPDAPEPPKKYESGEYVKWIQQAVAKVNVAKPTQTQEVVEKIVEKVVEKVVIKEVESGVNQKLADHNEALKATLLKMHNYLELVEKHLSSHEETDGGLQEVSYLFLKPAEAVQLSEKNCTNVVIKIQKETDEAIKNMLLETSNALTQAIPDAPEPPKKYESGEYVKWIEQAVAKVNVAKPTQTQEVVEKIVEKVVEKVVIKEVESGVNQKLVDHNEALKATLLKMHNYLELVEKHLSSHEETDGGLQEAVQLSEKNCTNVVIKIQKETDEAIKNMLLETSNALTQAIPDAPEPPKKYESGEYVKWIEQAVAKVNVAKPAQTQEVVEKIVEKVVEKVVIKEVESGVNQKLADHNEALKATLLKMHNYLELVEKHLSSHEETDGGLQEQISTLLSVSVPETIKPLEPTTRKAPSPSGSDKSVGCEWEVINE